MPIVARSTWRCCSRKWLATALCKILDRFQGVLFGQGKGHVFHRVRGYNQAVVATGIRSGKISFELDLDRQLADIVTVGQTRDLGNTNP